MATQNVAIPTSENASMLAMLATHIFENHGAEIGDAVIGKNFALTYMRQKAESEESGGLDFAEPVMINENSNFGFRDHYSTIPADIQDPTREFKFDPVSLTGTVVLNKKHELMNTGKAQIKKLMTTLKQHAESSIYNVMSRALWNASPTANVEPESLRSIITTTPTVGSLGGITRAGNAYAQNLAYTTAITSIGSAAGIAALHRQRAKLGGSAKTAPDFAVTTATIWGNLLGYLDSNRRPTSNEQMVKLGFENFYIGSALFGYDGDGGSPSIGGGECPANSLYFLNSKHLFFKVLAGGNMHFEPFTAKDNSLNYTSVFYMFYNLTTNLPSSLGVLSNITG
jgi:hypothetical protein